MQSVWTFRLETRARARGSKRGGAGRLLHKNFRWTWICEEPSCLAFYLLDDAAERLLLRVRLRMPLTKTCRT